VSADEPGGPALSIRRAAAQESERLFDIWWRSVCATHTFLSEADLRTLAPQVRDLGLAHLDTWVLCDGAQAAVGFLVLNRHHIEALFIVPEWLRRGAGTRLVRHARALRGALTLDVNEQNTPALRFYEAMGFSVVGRSATDGAGRPFPLLHLRQVA
jgi:putative acetyltransferase